MTNTWATGFQSGPPAVTAAEFAKGIGAIYNTTLGSAAANIDISGIIDDYAHLLVVAYLRGDAAATNVACNLRLNNDSGANYYSQETRASATTNSANEALAGTSVSVAPITPAGTGPANSFGILEILIANYAGTTNHKPVKATYFGHRATTTTNQFIGVVGGIWKATAAVTRITLLPSSGSWDTGSRVTVYGMGA